LPEVDTVHVSSALLQTTDKEQSAEYPIQLDALGTQRYDFGDSTTLIDRHRDRAMKNQPSRVVLILPLLLGAPVALAHHSVSGQFDTSKSITLKGVISRVEWINPHIYVHLDVKDENGTVTTWALETLPSPRCEDRDVELIVDGSHHDNPR
jgi:hypothetical protein